MDKHRRTLASLRCGRHLAGHRAKQPGKRFEERRLSRPVWAGYEPHVLVGDLDVYNRCDCAAVVTDHQISSRQHGQAHRGRRAASACAAALTPSAIDTRITPSAM